MPELALEAPSEYALSRTGPFPGLRAYREEDASWFYGRAGEVNELLKRLRRLHFVAVVGASGSGKSSLVRAGILPQIRDGYLDADWRIVTFRPGEEPILNLSEALATQIGLTSSTPRSSLADQLRSGPGALVRALVGDPARVLGQVSLPPDARVLILVDQFEELFQFTQRAGDSAQEEVKAFLKLLLTATVSTEIDVYVVTTMRLEWLGECAGYPGLAEAINEGLYLVPEMTRRQLRQAILEPLESAGGHITSALLDRMLNDLDGKSDQLPVLQHALMRLWQQGTPGETFDAAAYESVGTFSHCLSNHAEEVFSELTAPQQSFAERLFRSITQINRNRKIRRPRPVSDILAITGVSLAELAPVLEAFSRPGRSFLLTTQGVLTPHSIVDISHEALIRQWNRLSAWVDHEAEIEARLRRLTEDSADWDRDRKRSQSCLYTGSRLLRAEELQPSLDPFGTPLAFLKESRRQRFWHLVWTRGLSGGALLIIVGLAFALLLASRKRAISEQQRLVSEERLTQTNFEAAQRVANNAQKFQTEVAARIDAAKGNATALAALSADIQAQRVYVQYVVGNTPAAAMARTLQATLKHEGYAAPGTERVDYDKAPSRTEIRFFHPEDAGSATRLAGQLQATVGQPIATAYNRSFASVVPAGQFEVWLSRDFAARSTAAVTPAPAAPSPPGLTVSMTPDHLTEGGATTLHWQAENASSVQLEGLGSFGPVGSLNLKPGMSTTYTVLAQGPGGTTTRSATVTVAQSAAGLTAQQSLQQSLQQSAQQAAQQPEQRLSQQRQQQLAQQQAQQMAQQAHPPQLQQAQPEQGQHQREDLQQMDSSAKVRAALDRYRDAYQSESLDDLKRVWPGISRAQQKNMKAVFDNFNAIRLTLNCGEAHVSATSAEVSCQQSAVYTLKGQKQPAQTTSNNFTLSKQGDLWVIEAVR